MLKHCWVKRLFLWSQIMKAVEKQEEQWKIESDARTLKEAEIIKSDKKRFEKATNYLKGEIEASQKSISWWKKSRNLK